MEINFLEIENPVSSFTAKNNNPGSLKKKETSAKDNVSASDFNDVTLENQFLDEIIFEQFSDFVGNRLTYLDNLKTLGDNWISGNSKQPNDQVISLAKNVLAGLEKWFGQRLTKYYLIPKKIIMGPIPTGGISYEIFTNNNFKIFANIYNNGEIEVETQNEEGFYDEISANAATLLDSLVTLLIKNDYTRW